MSKKDFVSFVTPFGVAVFPSLSKPDTEGKFPTGKFQTSIAFEPADEKTIEGTFKDAAKQFFGKEAGEATFPRKVLKDGTVVWRAKSKKRPAVFDAKKAAIPVSAEIGGGSELRLSLTLKPWTKETKVKGEVVTEHFVSCWLEGVQVRKLVAPGEGRVAAHFDEVADGFEYDGEGDTANAPKDGGEFDL